MAQEIERKFLVLRDKWQPKDKGERICQGYLSEDKERTVRVRLKGEKAFLTVKGKNDGISRAEFEYEIPVKDGEAMLKLCRKPLVEKIRYCEEVAGHVWEIDCFYGANDGLIMAEVELANAVEEVILPSWAGKEVSADSRYYNANLRQHPYCEWKKD